MGMDISSMYFKTPLDRFEYIQIHIKIDPQESIDEYNLMDVVATDRYVYITKYLAKHGISREADDVPLCSSAVLLFLKDETSNH